ncbi:MAG: enoyl-CoA hydratase-related protein [Thermodesulfobacteriota bacterium]
MSETVLYAAEGGIAYLTLNRPQRRNALNQEMLETMLAGLARAGEDDAVRAICLQAAGEAAFCAGGDLSSAVPQAGRPGGAQLYAELLKAMAGHAKPLLAKVAAPCLAGGLGLVLASDIAIARSDVYFCAPEVKVGIFPYMVGALLWRDVAWKKAMDLALSGRRVPAAEAEAMGLISRAVAPESFEEVTAQVLAGLAAASPIGLRLGKDAFRRLQGLPLDQALDMLSADLARAVQTEDAAEGLKAFVEKRRPEFKGR